MKRLAACAAILMATAGQVRADFISFTLNPTTNSQDWSSFVTGLGGTVNSNVNFDAHPTGPLDPNFYLSSDGVMLTPIGDVNTVRFGAGPGQGNTSTRHQHRPVRARTRLRTFCLMVPTSHR